MGGNAFLFSAAQGEPTLNTPRLSPADYSRLKTTCKSGLQSFFDPETPLDTLSEAPEKESYGDIDFLVARDECVDWIALATAVGAAGVVCHHQGMCSLAIRKDGSRSERPPVIYKLNPPNKPQKVNPSTTITTEEYAQVDVECVPTELYAWRTFYSSFGDIGSLLGQVCRPLGFRTTSTGFWLRMRELDDAEKWAAAGTLQLNIADKDGLLVLSSDPQQIMSFLRLNSVRYGDGFDTLEEMFDWLGGCRLLELDAATYGSTKSDVRQKGKRTIYTQFFDEWLPAHRPYAASNDNAVYDPAKRDTVRTQLLTEALMFFKKQDEFEVMHDALVRMVNTALAAQLLRPIIALHSGKADKGVTEIVRAFKRFVNVNEAMEMTVSETAHRDDESTLWRLVVVGENKEMMFRDPGAVSEFSKEHWDKIRDLERKRVELAKTGWRTAMFCVSRKW
ncbi:hypothetical protein LTR97_009453 [Elasticomyces elasticus]|uniref:Uncharacterized protein n=1 Tax=Elasticomyces elasticus TaxID=574655 RepID=A0AAN7WBK2_9PEZI|nr:hypothetical protein LTR97_009453 [Elasticomyces elasticus]